MADETYEFKSDTNVKLEDGRQIQYAKGATISMDEARRLGVVKGKQTAGPSETKEEEPAEAKASKKAKK